MPGASNHGYTALITLLTGTLNVEYTRALLEYTRALLEYTRARIMGWGRF